MSDYILDGWLSDSGNILFVECLGCKEIHEHHATADIKAGTIAILAAKCAPTMQESSTDTSRLVPNRSGWLGRNYSVRIA